MVHVLVVTGQNAIARAVDFGVDRSGCQDCDRSRAERLLTRAAYGFDRGADR